MDENNEITTSGADEIQGDYITSDEPLTTNEAMDLDDSYFTNFLKGDNDDGDDRDGEEALENNDSDDSEPGDDNPDGQEDDNNPDDSNDGENGEAGEEVPPQEKEFQERVTAFEQNQREHITVHNQKMDLLGEAVGEIDNLADDLKFIMESNGLSETALAELKETDPQAYIRHNDEISKFNGLRKQAEEKRNQLQTIQNHNEKVAYDKYAAQEVEILKTMPEFKDQEAMNKTMPEVQKYLAEKNFSNEDINGLIDSRMYSVVVEALKYRSQKQEATEIVDKRVRNKPRHVKANSATEKGSRNGSALSKASNKFNKSQSMDDAMALLDAADIF